MCMCVGGGGDQCGSGVELRNRTALTVFTPDVKP